MSSEYERAIVNGLDYIEDKCASKEEAGYLSLIEEQNDSFMKGNFKSS